MTPPNRLTPEREQEIRVHAVNRFWFGHTYDINNQLELLEEIDALRAEADERNKWMRGQAQLLQDSVKERDTLKSEIELSKDGFAKTFTSVAVDNKKLRERIEKLREAIIDAIDSIHSEYCGHGDHDPCCKRPAEALAQDDKEKEK